MEGQGLRLLLTITTTIYTEFLHLDLNMFIETGIFIQLSAQLATVTKTRMGHCHEENTNQRMRLYRTFTITFLRQNQHYMNSQNGEGKPFKGLFFKSREGLV
ncbi:hypothetical protein K7432_016581 [Basidiobolus ranarum]|uniref:Uncharacterized protein n=1 Tax=Basidiobolus ranarum TaxID=34480 RepID=A0ABR2VLH0_9FUNG